MDYDFDVIVIGSGASGGTLAADIASAGKRVLLLERGLPTTHQISSEEATLIAKTPYDDRLIDLNDRPSRLYMGSGPGGGTSVYGGALLRPSEHDFHPGRHYANRIPRELYDWPICYDDLKPFYDRAEKLYSVAAVPFIESSPLPSPVFDAANPPLPLAPVNQKILDRTRAAKLNPFRLPLGIETSRCLKCASCAGFVCPTGARRSAAQLVAESSQSGHFVTVLNGREVTRVNKTNGRITSIDVNHRPDSSSERYTAKRYVMAAGAAATPAILQQSGFEHDQLGRNYMLHYSPLAVGLFLPATEADRTFVKQLGFTDFYFGTSELPEKMGIVQSLPAPGPLMLKKNGLKYIPTAFLNRLRSHMLPFVGIVEDLPNPLNRVTISPNGGIRIDHRFSDYDRRRGAALTVAMVKLLKTAGAIHCISKQIPSTEHVAHQCGTVRFGNDSRHAVVDSDCRMFGCENLFVVDGSILPTSLGIGPSLTLMANALRISQILQKEI